MKAVILSTLILFFHLNLAFGQITCVESGTLCSKLGLEMSYCTVSLGRDGVCSKYKVTIYENNNSDKTISIEGAQIYIDPKISIFAAAGSCGKREEYAGPDGIIWIEFPWNNTKGLKTEIPPNSSFQKSFIVYTKKELPEIGVRSSVYARYINDKSSSNNNAPGQRSGSQNQTTNNAPNQRSGSQNQTTNNQNNNSQNGSTSGGGLSPMAVQEKLNEVQAYLDKAQGNDAEGQSIVNDATSIINNSSTSDQTKINQLSPLVARAKNRANSLSSSRKQADDTQSAAETAREREAQTAKEQAKKEAEAKSNRFNGHMQKGDNSLSNGKYDEAVAHYNNAFREAATEAEGQQAVNGVNRANKAKADAARVVRTDNKKAREKEVDTQAAAATAGIAALMALLSDRYDDKPVNFRAQAGLGLESIPIILNSQFSKRSTIETTFHYSVMMGLKLGIANHKGVSFHLNPVFYGGFNAGSKGTDGTHIGYGGFGTLQMGLKAESKFKLYAEGGWLARDGNYNYDGDVASGGTTANDDVRRGTYDYNLTRFGGGVMLHFINDPHETYIKAGIYFEKLSFATQKPQMVGSLQINISSQIVIDFLYSKNYAIAGKADYPNSLTTSSSILPELNNRSYFSIRIIRQGMF